MRHFSPVLPQKSSGFAVPAVKFREPCWTPQKRIDAAEILSEWSESEKA